MHTKSAISAKKNALEFVNRGSVYQYFGRGKQGEETIGIKGDFHKLHRYLHELLIYSETNYTIVLLVYTATNFIN